MAPKGAAPFLVGFLNASLPLLALLALLSALLHSLSPRPSEVLLQWEEADEQSAAAATDMILTAVRRVKAAPQHQRLARGLPGCILYADNRRLNAASLRDSGKDSFEAHGREFPYWLATKLINRAYARRHGYRFVEMGEEDKEADRHPSWFKVRFLQRQLACCCQWAFFLDSDAYFRMDNHRLSLSTWVDRLTLPHYFDWISQQHNISLLNQTWFPRPPASIFSHSPPTCSQGTGGVRGAGGGGGEEELEGGRGGGGGREGESRAAVCVIVPRNDDEASGMAEGRAGALFNSSLEYVNAGVSLWRRSPHCLKLLASWHAEPAKQYMWRRNWEQPRLNVLLALPQHAADVAVVPFRELTGHSGRAVRHRWLNSIMTDETRSDLVKDALLGSFLTSYMYMFE